MLSFVGILLVTMGMAILVSKELRLMISKKIRFGKPCQ